MSNLFDSENAATGEPSEIIKGDYTQWKRSDLTDYAPATYDLKYSARLSGNGAEEITITAAADGTDFLVTEASTVTTNYVAGTYHWQAYIVRQSDSARILIDRGQWTVKANLDTDATDPRTHAEIMVDKIESVLENRAGSDINNYSISGRQITKLSPNELLQWRDYYRSEITAEEAETARDRGKVGSNSILVRFT